MAEDKGLSAVTYSRSYDAERHLPAVLVGASRWLRDIELLMEDNWPELRQADLGDAAAELVVSSNARLALVQGTSEVDRVRLCIEATLPANIKKVILLSESEGPFVKKNYMNYAARSGYAVIELPDDPKAAATELSGLLSALLAKARTEIGDDIESANLVVDGFQMNTSVTELKFARWNERCDRVLSWLFPIVTISTEDYHLIRLLSRARPMFARKAEWPATVTELLLPLEAYCKATLAIQYLDLAVSLIELMPGNGSSSEERMAETVKNSALGLLTKRALLRELKHLASAAAVAGSNRRAA